MIVLMTSVCGKNSNSLNSGNEIGRYLWAVDKQLADQTEYADVLGDKDIGCSLSECQFEYEKLAFR